MKKSLRLICILLSLFLQGQLLANTVIVKGTVKDSANHPIANKTVKIYSTDSSNNGCILSHTTVTNANGYYIDTLTCNHDIRKLAIIVESCNGVNITHDPAVTSTNIVESNFIICTAVTTTPAPVTCKAAFSYTSLATGIKFNGAGSATVSGDSIISRTWVFGDSSAALTGNTIDPTHAYNKPGSYNVCLTIKTKKGCESSFCQVIVFTPASNDCNVQVKISSEMVSNKNYRFNSSQSSTLQGDSIVQRTWKFSDGSSLDGNQVNPLKVFKDTGVYNVCLSVRTMKGCEKQLCITVAVHDSVRVTPAPVNCKSQFVFTVQNMTVKFNSAGSAAPSGDSIISRTWIFGDTSAQLTGNRVDPSHIYTKAGNYTACLYIKTKSGCESKYCADFTLRDSVVVPTSCKAFFTYTIKDSTVQFNSAGSLGTSADDSIISRTWYYADSANGISLGGNVIAPSYKYAKPGTYPVYLVIKTKKGCESRFSATVTIPGHPVPTNCKALFTFTVQNNVVKFSSAGSAGTSATDSIISRVWLFGDSSTISTAQGNIIDPSHTYAKSGKYTVTLYIKTKAGCESKYTAIITIGTINCTMDVQFTAERVSLKKVQFNSRLSVAPVGDSIIQRNWKFGDNTVLSGNEISTVKEFTAMGIYNSCLSVRTLNGCEAQSCKQVIVQDTVTTPQSTVDYIKIISINPNPVITRMMTTIFSRNSNVEAEISIYDIYGTRKLTVKKLLAQGNNIFEIATESLYHGQYFLKVSSKNGADSKAFYKL